MIIDLSGSWKFSGFLENGNEVLDSMVATVPCNIENTLFENGIIDDPYIRLNAKQLRKFEFYSWVFERQFECGDISDKLELIFEGLDCYASIRINEIEVGQADNALITQKFDISKAVKTGINNIKVVIRSANNIFRGQTIDALNFSVYPFNYESLRVRKPAHAWGWDIAPRMALGGIFRPVYIQPLPENRFVDCFIQLLKLHESSASMSLHFNFATSEAILDNLTIECTGVCAESKFSAGVAAWLTSGVLRFEIDNPKLWFPRGYGDPHLYKVKIRLLKNKTICLAEKELTIGVRKVELKVNPVWTEGDTPDFQFIVNNQPVNIKGTNHVPADALHSNDPKRLPEIIEMACDLNCNMLRVWGGGIYESPIFYDLCDQNGILIWHDFMLSCLIYPQDEAFLEKIKAEAVAVIKSLRQHPSIAIWAGDNECDCMPFWMLRFDPNRNRITREILPRAVLSNDPTRPFLPSSPYYSPEAVAKSAAVSPDMCPESMAPETHLWGPRDYFKSDFYRNTRASFTSEIGYHGCPNTSSIKRFVSPDKLWPYTDNEEWDYHASNPFIDGDSFLNYRTTLMADQVKEMFGFIPDNLPDYALASQICQAEAKKFFIELVRSRKKMTGILWWNLIDCWPQFSDAVVDYYYGKKLAYHFIKRVQADVLVMVSEASNWRQKVIIANDTGTAKTGCYKVWDSATGEILSARKFTVISGGLVETDQFKVCTTQKRLLLISWELSDGTKGSNHAVTGSPQFDLEIFRNQWLKSIAQLDGSFDPETVGK